MERLTWVLLLACASAGADETGFDVRRPDAVNAYTRCSRILQRACPPDLGHAREGAGQIANAETSNNSGSRPPIGAVMTAGRNRRGQPGIYVFREGAEASPYGQSYFCPLPAEVQTRPRSGGPCQRLPNGAATGCAIELQMPVGHEEAVLGTPGSVRNFNVNYSPNGVVPGAGSFLFGSTGRPPENRVQVPCVADGAPPRQVTGAVEADLRARLLGGRRSMILGNNRYGPGGIVACAKRQMGRADSAKTLAAIYDDEKPSYLTDEEWAPVRAAQGEKAAQKARLELFSKPAVQRKEKEYWAERLKGALTECSALLYPTPRAGESRVRYTPEFAECLIPGSGNSCFQRIEALLGPVPTGTAGESTGSGGGQGRKAD
jgi:hypothetical protein